jgi:hypothetical protein
MAAAHSIAAVKSGHDLSRVLLSFVCFSTWFSLCVGQVLEAATFGTNSATINNKYYPLNVGARFTMKGTGEIAGITVTGQATSIETVNGVSCIKVGGTAPDGTIYEWLAQDTSGDVWRLRQYDVALNEYDEDDYLYMPANPQVGDTITLWLLDFEVISTTAQVTVPAGTYSGCLHLQCIDSAWPEEQEYYAPWVGEIKEFDDDGGWELTSVSGLNPPPAVPSITTSSPLPAGTVGTAYNQPLAATGGTTPYAWAISSGSLPTGLTLSSAGVISGTPGNGATTSFTVRVTGKNGQSATKNFGMTVNPAALPAILVEQPTGTNMVAGGARDFGALAIGSATSLTFTIRNNGTTPLAGIALTKDGSNAADFSVTTAPATSVTAGSSTTFTIAFTPTTLGSRVAALHIASNDTTKNPFNISVSGTGITVFQEWMKLAGVPSNQSGAMQTPHSDGVPNLLKFAFNLDPTKPDFRKLTAGANGVAGLPGFTRLGNRLRLEFVRRRATSSPGIIYTAQFASDLSNWIDFTGPLVSVVSIDATWERVVVEDVPPPGATSRFGRLKIEAVP